MQDNFAYLLPFIMGTFGVILLCLGASGFRAARHWGAGYLLAALGFIMPMILKQSALVFHALAANVLFLAAFFLYGHALLVQFGVATRFKARLAFAILAFAAVSFFILVKTDLRAELALGDFGCAMLLAPSLWLVRKKLRHPSDKALFTVAAGVVGETLLRIAILLFSTPHGTMRELEDFLTSDYAYLMQVMASILGFLLGLAVIASMISHALRQHRHAAEHDPMTGLYNRRGFDAALAAFPAAGVPAGAVVMADIDHFKQVNDRFGHAAGDRVIAALGTLMSAQLPGDALIARFGGEEFVAFLPGASPAAAATFCNRIRQAVAGYDWHGNGVERQVTISFGVSATTHTDTSFYDAVRRADQALYRAKANGRDQVFLDRHDAPAGGGPSPAQQRKPSSFMA